MQLKKGRTGIEADEKQSDNKSKINALALIQKAQGTMPILQDLYHPAWKLEKVEKPTEQGLSCSLSAARSLPLARRFRTRAAHEKKKSKKSRPTLDSDMVSC